MDHTINVMDHTIDLSSRCLDKIELIPHADPLSINYDNNLIRHVNNLHQYQHLQQLSLANNQLVEMSGVSHLCNLTSLNLSNNNISIIQGLGSLVKLTVCNLSRNQIKHVDGLSENIYLQHLDVSNNQITSVTDLQRLTKLKVLLLHGNELCSLKFVALSLPRSLLVLSLSDNNISDLNELYPLLHSRLDNCVPWLYWHSKSIHRDVKDMSDVLCSISHLSYLNKLEQLSIMNNPCVMPVSTNIVGFDYRPYVINWCFNLQLLDGHIITDREALKAEWLYSQGKGRQFQSGQHYQLIQYLMAVCPRTDNTLLDRNEDVKLSRVLHQQRLQQQRLQQGQRQQLLQQQQLKQSLDVAQMNLTSAVSNAGLHDMSSMLKSESCYLPLPSDLLSHSPPASQQQRQQQVLLSDQSGLYPTPMTTDMSELECVAEREFHGNDENEDVRNKETREDKKTREGLVIKPFPVTKNTNGIDLLTTAKSYTSSSTSPSDMYNVLEEFSAIKLQSFWRGYRARNCDPRVIAVRTEIRCRRSQQHIKILEKTLSQQSELFEKEKQLRLLHVETMKQLWAEVKSLKEWKNNVDKSSPLVTRSPSLTHSSTSSSPASPTINARSTANCSVHTRPCSVIHKAELTDHSTFFPTTLGVSSHDSETGALRTMCTRLQEEVRVLKTMLTVLSSSLGVDCSNASISNYNNTTLPGLLVLAPTNVYAARIMSTSALLKWRTVEGGGEREGEGRGGRCDKPNKHILGYRLYINNEPRHLICGNSMNTALITSLTPNTTYRVCMRTVGVLVESCDSNVIEFTTKTEEDKTRFQNDDNVNWDEACQLRLSGRSSSSSLFTDLLDDLLNDLLDDLLVDLSQRVVRCTERNGEKLDDSSVSSHDDNMADGQYGLQDDNHAHRCHSSNGSDDISSRPHRSFHDPNQALIGAIKDAKRDEEQLELVISCRDNNHHHHDNNKTSDQSVLHIATAQDVVPLTPSVMGSQTTTPSVTYSQTITPSVMCSQTTTPSVMCSQTTAPSVLSSLFSSGITPTTALHTLQTGYNLVDNNRNTTTIALTTSTSTTITAAIASSTCSIASTITSPTMSVVISSQSTTTSNQCCLVSSPLTGHMAGQVTERTTGQSVVMRSSPQRSPSSPTNTHHSSFSKRNTLALIQKSFEVSDEHTVKSTQENMEENVEKDIQEDVQNDTEDKNTG